MTSIELTQDTYRLLMEVADIERSPGRISGFMWDMCLGRSRARLAASPRPGRTWHEVYAPCCVGPVPAPGSTAQALPERAWKPSDMVSIALAPYASDLLLATVGDDHSPEKVDRCVWDLCLAYYRTELVASPRPECPDEVLEVAAHLSYVQGIASDFQGVAVVACAHAPACQRLTSVMGYAVETVSCETFAAWLQGKAEEGAEAERVRSEGVIDVEARAASCQCLEGTPVSYPRGYPDQPDDLVFLVGKDLAERYEDLFSHRYFGTHTVEEIEDVGGVKSRRWFGYSHEELYGCTKDHDDDEECPDERDWTFECDRNCHEGCDWVLYPRDGRARLAVHGNDIDLGPLEEDHTAELVDHLLPDLRL